VRTSGRPTFASQRQTPHGSALPLLVTIAMSLMLSFAIIALTATGAFADLETAALLIA